MKQKVFLSISFFLIGICIGGVAECVRMSSNAEKEKQTLVEIIENSRTTIIELNTEYNKMFNNLGVLALRDNNDYARAAAQVLQQLFPKLISLNKSLKLDCTEYKNGAPVSIQDENGKTTPLEKLPEEIRLNNR